MSKKAWSGRFTEQESPLMERFNASITFDKRLYKEDIEGSRAHAHMLHKIGLLGATELKKIHTGLDKVLKEIESNQFQFTLDLEDIHMAVESRLTEIIGPLGGKLHTARSRNDQVATDLKLYSRRITQNIIVQIETLQKTLIKLADNHSNTVLPGYTHLQRAQPILLAHHFLAYFEMLERDKSRFHDNLKRLDQCPLGAGALAGSPVPIDRKLTAKLLNFSDTTHNSLDSVSDRDFVLDFLSSAAIIMAHLSRLSEELVLWSSQEFGFVRLPQNFCTGSSMMPQKVNPDAPELIRGKTGRVYGNLTALLTTMKSLPLAYNKDMQEDKEPFFDSVDTLTICLDVLNTMLPDLIINQDMMLSATAEGFLIATDLADYLAQKGLPFRDAHAVVGKLVQHCISSKTVLENLDLKILQKFSSYFASDVTRILSVQHSVNTRQSIGGTALTSIKAQLRRARKLLQK